MSAATPHLGPRNAGSWPSSPWPPREVHVWLEEKVGAGPRNGIVGFQGIHMFNCKSLQSSFPKCEQFSLVLECQLFNMMCL